ncbi:MAG: hypothetical protein BGO70_10760 [Bacteroidetes bacterium 43-93]|nr:DUF1737 domain-containing protein [Bacteroidota bacterium]OJW95596.1 MAG: hypothetical protein BGO70_10760 [Bacteroidetes bacterium 43-93]
MEYTIITALNKDQFIQKVNGMIREGWEPQGGVTQLRDYYSPTELVQPVNTENMFAQAMIKR